MRRLFTFTHYNFLCSVFLCIITLALLTINQSYAYSELCLNQSMKFAGNELLQQQAIQANGRVKPIIVHSSEMLKYLTGKSSFTYANQDKIDSFQAYCLLSTRALRSKKQNSNVLTLYPKLEHPELLKYFDNKTPSFDELDAYGQDLRFESVKAGEGSSYQKAIRKLQSKISLYNEIIAGQNWKIPLTISSETKWFPLFQVASQINPNLNLRQNSSNQESKNDQQELLPTSQVSKQQLEQLLVKAYSDYNRAFPESKHKVEYIFNKLRLSSVAFFLSLLSLALLVLIKTNTIPLISIALTFMTQVVYIGFRIYISQRAPITNMYETVLFSGFGALAFALLFGHLKKDRIFLYVGLAYNAMTLLMLNFSGGLLSSNISPLVPVLRDNFWLSTHVTTIILSYGALALSWVMANIIIVRNRFKPIDKKELQKLSHSVYLCLMWGTTMLAAGIILGGVWADYSWGRFWGWDPKETWSLIVFCIYIAILHGRYTKLIPNERFIPLVALSFLSVMMAWFGVNYILATGLHSYGFSEGGAYFLLTFTLVQFVLMGFCKNLKRLSI